MFLSKMTLNMKINSNDFEKGWDLACYHHFTNMVCGNILRGLWKKIDTLRVQTGPFLSKYQGFDRKQPHYKDNTFFLNPLNPKLFMCSTLSIHTNILKFQTFLTSFDNFNAFNELFFSKITPKLKINSNDL